MRHDRAARFPGRQGGATLVIALLILVLIMMIGITAVSTSNTQYKLAGNLQFEDGALNNAESAITAAESWLSTGTNFKNNGFTGRNAALTPQLYPIGTAPNPLTMAQWLDSTDDVANANSVSGNDPLTGARNTSQRYFIEQMSINNRLQGSSQAVGGRSSSGCNQVNTYLITARGLSARGATKFVQSFYSVLSC